MMPEPQAEPANVDPCHLASLPLLDELGGESYPDPSEQTLPSPHDRIDLASKMVAKFVDATSRLREVLHDESDAIGSRS